jgi:hypothetical protein
LDVAHATRCAELERLLPLAGDAKGQRTRKLAAIPKPEFTVPLGVRLTGGAVSVRRLVSLEAG